MTYKNLGPEIEEDPLRPKNLRRFMIHPISSALPFRDQATEAEENHSSPVWLISFTDLMALMLTFFVLSFSMSEPDEQAWSKLQGALQSQFEEFQGPKSFEGGAEVISLPRVTYNRALNLDYLSALLTTKLEENRYLSDVSVINQRDRLLLSLSSDLLFESGQAKISQEGIKAINALVPALNRIKNAVEVVGHSDPRPVSGDGQYISNWHLSLERARSVAHLMKQKGYQKPVRVEGFSSARFEEMDASIEQSTRMDIARRVDIVILGTDGQRTDELKLKLDD